MSSAANIVDSIKACRTFEQTSAPESTGTTTASNSVSSTGGVSNVSPSEAAKLLASSSESNGEVDAAMALAQVSQQASSSSASDISTSRNQPPEAIISATTAQEASTATIVKSSSSSGLEFFLPVGHLYLRT